MKNNVRNNARQSALIRFYNGVVAIALKEVLHITRDKLTLALLISVPLAQLLLFGFAINLHPKHLPTALLAYESNAFVNRAVNELETLGYFKIVAKTNNKAEADHWLANSKVQFVLALPHDFGISMITGETPEVTLIADATDPIASLVATQAASVHYAAPASHQTENVHFKVESRFNADNSSRLYILPGLLGVILTLTMILLGSLCLVREYEQGSMETLSLLPIPRAAIYVGKIAPYFLIGFLLFWLLLVICVLSLGLNWHTISFAFIVTVTLFILANLTLGCIFSQLAKSQMQAMQMAIFFFLPSMLLSGFMFPFYGMPAWARAIGECLPLTHFLRVIRGVLLKNLHDMWMHTYPIALFCLLSISIGIFLIRNKR